VEQTGPPCDRLLEDPEAVLADRNKWPDHICSEVARASTKRWALNHARQVIGGELPTEVLEWAQIYPLPVGAWSEPHIVYEPTPLLAGRLSRPGIAGGALVVLPTVEKAALILTFNIRLVDVAAFGIVDDHPTVLEVSRGAFSLMPVTMQFTVSGWRDERVDAVCKHASRWWEWLSGGKITGRPEGRSRSIDDVMAAFQVIWDDTGRQPTKRDVAQELGVSEKTVNGIHGMASWADFAREALQRVRRDAS